MNILNFKKNIYILILLIFIACNKEAKMPIEPNTMVQILADIHVAEASLDNEIPNVKDSMSRVYYKQIFEKHKVTRIEFDSSMSILTSNAPLTDGVYTKVIKELKDRNSDTTSVK